MCYIIVLYFTSNRNTNIILSLCFGRHKKTFIIIEFYEGLIADQEFDRSVLPSVSRYCLNLTESSGRGPLINKKTKLCCQRSNQKKKLWFFPSNNGIRLEMKLKFFRSYIGYNIHCFVSYLSEAHIESHVESISIIVSDKFKDILFDFYSNY